MNSGFNFSTKQSGFSLVELMIAGVLGLLLIGGVLQLFIGSNQNYRMQSELSTIQEEGRFALMFLQRQIEQAGWVDVPSTQVPPAIDFSQSTNAANDSIAITHVRTVDGVRNRDCNGTEVGDGVITNIFSVNADKELVCNGQPLIQGVDSFQVLYGVDTDRGCPDGLVDRYMNRNQVNNNGYTESILSVRVALLLASEQEVLLENDSRKLKILERTSQNNNQKFARRVFEKTIFMPNAAFNLLTNSDRAIQCMFGI